MAAVGIGGFHGGVFATMKFPPYKFVEYPKWITKPDGTRMVVQDQSEELRIKAELPAQRPQTELERERDGVVVERDHLAQVVASKDAELAKLREQLASAQTPTPAVEGAKPAVGVVVKK